jgi:hypothetical protein
MLKRGLHNLYNSSDIGLTPLKVRRGGGMRVEQGVHKSKILFGKKFTKESFVRIWHECETDINETLSVPSS